MIAPPTIRAFGMVLWIAVLAVVLFGYFRIEVGYARVIDAARARLSAVDDRIDRARRILHNHVALLAARRNIVRDIAVSGRSGGINLSLRGIDRAARRTGVAILSISPAGPAREPQRWLQSTLLHFVVRGSFESFLRFLPRLGREDPLLDVRSVAVTSADRTSASALSFAVDAYAYAVSQPSERPR